MAAWTEFEELLQRAGMNLTLFSMRYFDRRSTSKLKRWKDQDDVPRWAIESLKGYIEGRRKHGDRWE